eukprot:1150777-Rhodomonas_salina.1
MRRSSWKIEGQMRRVRGSEKRRGVMSAGAECHRPALLDDMTRRPTASSTPAGQCCHQISTFSLQIGKKANRRTCMTHRCSHRWSGCCGGFEMRGYGRPVPL